MRELLGAIGAVLLVITIIVTAVTGSPEKGGKFFMAGVSVIAKPFTWSIERAGVRLQERLAATTHPTTK